MQLRVQRAGHQQTDGHAAARERQHNDRWLQFEFEQLFGQRVACLLAVNEGVGHGDGPDNGILSTPAASKGITRSASEDTSEPTAKLFKATILESSTMRHG